MSPGSTPTDDLILAFDAGTQSVRCGLFDLAGQLVDLVKLPIEPYFSPGPGFAEQQPAYFWQKLCEASQQLIAGNRGLLDRIKAVTLTTQRACTSTWEGTASRCVQPSRGSTNAWRTNSAGRLVISSSG